MTILLEDTCESMGSKYRDTKLGTFGKMSSFSTFFGHHISTIEGGFISTDDKDLYDILLAIKLMVGTGFRCGKTD